LLFDKSVFTEAVNVVNNDNCHITGNE